MHSQEWYDGFDAAERGQPISSSPYQRYVEECDLHFDWESGWKAFHEPVSPRVPGDSQERR